MNEPGWRSLAAATAAAARFFVGRVRGSWVPGYLAGRGFPPGLWHRYGAGYAPPEWSALAEYLRGLGFADSVIETAGLARRAPSGVLVDVFRDRLMFPVRTADGIVAGFIGRAAEGGRSGPPYLNTGTTPLYRKGELLFGMHEARRALAVGAIPVLTEGPADAMAVTGAARSRCVGLAACGTALTAAQVSVLHDVADAPTVLVAFDGDAPGQAAALRAYELLRDDRPRAVVIPGGQDPAGYYHRHGPAALAALLAGQARPLADLVIDAKLAQYDRWRQFPEGAVGALHAVAPVIARLPHDQVARQVARVAAHLNASYDEVTQAVMSALEA